MNAPLSDETTRLTLNKFDPVPVGVLITAGENHRVVYMNHALRAMFGDRRTGTPVREVFGDLLQQDSLRLFDRVLRTGEGVRLQEIPARVASAQGGSQERFFQFSLSRISLEGGESGVLQVILEVTDQYRISRRMRGLARKWCRLQRRYQSLLWVGAHVVWVSGPHGEIGGACPGWERLTGQTWEESRGHGWLRAVHPEDRAPTLEAWRRAAEELPTLWEHVLRVRVTDGSYRHLQLRAVPVCEGDTLVEWVVASTDIEQQWQEDRRSELLDRAAAAMADITNMEEMFDALAKIIVLEFADGCHIYLLPELPRSLPEAPILTERIATAARAGLPRLPPRRKELHPFDGDLMRAVRQRRLLYLTFPPGRPPPRFGARVGAWMTEAKANSLVILPVVAEGEVAAVVTASTCGDRPSISLADVDLMGQILDHTHDALGKALRFRRTQRVGLALQHSLLAEPLEVPGLEINFCYQASPTAADIGGDWYDAFVLPGGAVQVVIGDVAGHDLTAIVNMGQVRNMLRALAVDRNEPPGDTLRRLDTAIEILNVERTASCVLVRLDRAEQSEWRLSYAVAGHPPPLLITWEGASRFLHEADNPLLGTCYDQPWTSAVEPLPPGSMLLLYTDGLIERRGEDLDRGLDRLRRHAVLLAREPLDRVCDKLLAAMPVAGEDDIALIAVRPR